MSSVALGDLMKSDVSTIKTWLTTIADCPAKRNKILNLLIQYMLVSGIDICQVIIDSGQLSDEEVPLIMDMTCILGQVSLAQLIVRRCCASTQDMHHALCN